MSWVSLIVLVLRLGLALTNLMERRQMIAAAEAKVLKEALTDADTRLAKVRAARIAAEREFDETGINDADPNLRD